MGSSGRGNEMWKRLIKDSLRDTRSTRGMMAGAVGVDLSYISMMSSKGCIPRRDIVRRIADFFHGDRDSFLITAGFAPEGVSIEDVLEVIRAPHNGAWSALEPELQKSLSCLKELDQEEQLDAASFLEGCVFSLLYRRTR